MMKASKLKLKCPVCGLPVEIPGDVMDGELVEHDCGATLEVKVGKGEVELVEFEGSIEDWGE
ncbi:MAG: sulfonate ABC transporter [Desulfurococcales archaeon]|nr:sulfonate ABC transporter [Desulfurococcales archaeon]MCE4605448.1 sulfonate ABC transporter [Desulfurococcales archaeon]